MLTSWISLRVSHMVMIRWRLRLWSSESLTGWDIQDGTLRGWQLVLLGSWELQGDDWLDYFTWPLHVNWLFIASWLDSKRECHVSMCSNKQKWKIPGHLRAVPRINITSLLSYLIGYRTSHPRLICLHAPLICSLKLFTKFFLLLVL